MNYLSLFSGIGGFDLAFTRAGMTCVGMCEIDKNCQAIERRHFPGVPIFDDVRDIGAKTHERGTIDLICGGFPCQDLSVAGKRAGLAGERSGLWFEFARVIDELEPKWVVIENVPGLLSSNGGKDFAVIIRWLAERGYGVAWRVLDAQYFGLAQRRRRVFVVASLGSGRCAEVLFEREGGAGDTPPSREAGEGTANDAPTSTLRGFGHGWQGQHNDTNPVIAKAVRTPTGGIDREDMHTLIAMPDPSYAIQGNGSKFGSGRNNQDTFVAVHETGKGFWSEGLPGMRGQPGGMPENIVAYTIQQNDGGNHKRQDRPNGGMYVKEADKSLTLGSTDQTVVAFNADRDGVNTLDNLSPTLTHKGDNPEAHKAYNKVAIAWEMQHASEAYRESGDISPNLQARMGTGGNNVPLVGVRRLTPTECERLQGFPDGWTDGQSDSTRYRQLGNAVAVPVITWIANRII